jgi:hypothetical protein
LDNDFRKSAAEKVSGGHGLEADLAKRGGTVRGHVYAGTGISDVHAIAIERNLSRYGVVYI